MAHTGADPGKVFQLRISADPPYLRQPLPGPDITPEAFTVQVGEQWAASLPTMEWLKIGLQQQFRKDLPSFVSPIFPYRFAANLFVGPSEQYVASLLHEATHAYQGITAPARLEAAENANRQWQDLYPWEDEVLHEDWQKELDLLNQALKAQTPAETRGLAVQFLQQREARRHTAQLSENQIAFERNIEWEEGIAKYVELEIYRQAANTPTYEPSTAIQADPAFRAYRGFQQRWKNEVNQVRLMAGDEGDGRFYYTGMAQAVMLDQLLPGWKTRLFDEGVWLEDLLAEAVQQNS